VRGAVILNSVHDTACVECSTADFSLLGTVTTSVNPLLNIHGPRRKTSLSCMLRIKLEIDGKTCKAGSYLLTILSFLYISLTLDETFGLCIIFKIICASRKVSFTGDEQKFEAPAEQLS
jgi:hypothetical protein